MVSSSPFNGIFDNSITSVNFRVKCNGFISKIKLIGEDSNGEILFLSFKTFETSFCGNGVIEDFFGEECDPPSNFCTSWCTKRKGIRNKYLWKR